MSLMAVVALASALSVPLQSQDAPPTVLSDVVVTGAPQTEEAARQFARTVAVSPAMAASIATWQTPLCLDVWNLAPSVTEVLRAHIEAHALNLGLEVGRPGCAPDVRVIATASGRDTATALVEEQPKAFRRSSGPTQLSHQALRRFAESDAPVRWWNTSVPYDPREGTVLAPIDGFRAGISVSSEGAMFGAYEMQALLSAIVIIDASKTADVPLTTLADYIAFVILAEVDATQDFHAYPSILNLFASGAPGSMTEWDHRYLNALYLAPVRARNTRVQLGEIARLMAAPEAPVARLGRRR